MKDAIYYKRKIETGEFLMKQKGQTKEGRKLLKFKVEEYKQKLKKAEVVDYVKKRNESLNTLMDKFSKDKKFMDNIKDLDFDPL